MKKIKRGLALILAVALVLSNGIYSMSSSLKANAINSAAITDVSGESTEIQDIPDTTEAEGVAVSIQEPANQAEIEAAAVQPEIAKPQQMPSAEQPAAEEPAAEQPVENKFNVVINKPAIDGGIIKVWTTGEKAEVSYDGNNQYKQEIIEGTPFNIEITVNENFVMDKLTDQVGIVIEPKSVNDKVYTYEFGTLKEIKEFAIAYSEIKPETIPASAPEIPQEAVPQPAAAEPADVILNYVISDSEGGIVEPESEIVKNNGSEQAKGSRLYLSNGWNFKGWMNSAKEVVSTDIKFNPEQIKESGGYVNETFTAVVEKPDSATIKYKISDPSGGVLTSYEETVSNVGGQKALGSNLTLYTSWKFDTWRTETGIIVSQNAEFIPQPLAESGLYESKTYTAYVAQHSHSVQYMHRNSVYNEENGEGDKDYDYQYTSYRKLQVDCGKKHQLIQEQDRYIYKFQGWKTKSESLEINDGAIIMPCHDVTIYGDYYLDKTIIADYIVEHKVPNNPALQKELDKEYKSAKRNFGFKFKETPLELDGYRLGDGNAGLSILPLNAWVGIDIPMVGGIVKGTIVSDIHITYTYVPDESKKYNFNVSHVVEGVVKKNETEQYSAEKDITAKPDEEIIKTGYKVSSVEIKPMDIGTYDTEWLFSGKMPNKDVQVIYNYVPEEKVTYSYNIKYVGPAGQKLMAAKVDQKGKGDSITAAPEEINGYVLEKGTVTDELADFDDKWNFKGIMPDKDVTITYTYKSDGKTEFPFDVKYELANDISKSDETKHLITGKEITASPRTFEGYKLTSSVVTPQETGKFDGNNNFSGTMPNTAVQVTYTYQEDPNAKFTFGVKYLTSDGKVLGEKASQETAVGTSISALAQTFSGYKLKRVEVEPADWTEYSVDVNNDFSAKMPRRNITVKYQYVVDNSAVYSDLIVGYDGTAKQLKDAVPKVTEGTKIYYVAEKSEDGKQIDITDKQYWSKKMPSYTEAGHYKVYAIVLNDSFEKPYYTYPAVLTITKRPITITGKSNHNAVYNGETQEIKGFTPGAGQLLGNHEIIAEASASGKEARAEAYSGKITKAEQVIIQEKENSNRAVTANYEVKTNPGQLIIKKAPAAYNQLSIKPKKPVYDGTEKKLEKASVKYEEGTIIYYSKTGNADDWSTAMPAFTEAGKYTVYVKAENSNCETATASAVLLIRKRALDLTAKNVTKTYNGSEQTTDEYNAGKDQLLKKHSITVTVLGTGKDVGEYDVNISDSQNVIVHDEAGKIVTPNYKITTTSGKLTIVSAPASENEVAFSGKELLYDGTFHKLEAAQAKDMTGSTISYSVTPEDNNSWKTELPEFKDAGIYTITAKAENKNYEDITTEATLVITKRPLSIIGNSLTTTYTGQKQSITGVTYGQIMINDTDKADELVKNHVTNAEAIAEGIEANIYEGTITQVKDVKVSDESGADVTNNYAIQTTKGSLIINVAGTEVNQIVFADDRTIYDGTAKQLPAATAAITEGTTISYTSTPNDERSWKTEMPAFAEAGDHTVFARAENPSVTGYTQARAVLYIEKRDLVITANSKLDAVYTGSIQTVEGFVAGEEQLAENQSIEAVAAAQETDAGEYKVEITAADKVKILDADKKDEAKNYNITTIPGKLVIAKATGNDVFIDEKSAGYDGEKHKLEDAASKITEDTTILYSKDGKEWGKEMPKFTDVGNHTVYVKVENKNYEDVYGEETLTISKRPINLNGNTNLKAVYNGKLQEVKGFTTGDGQLVKGQKITADAKAEGTEADTYPGTITGSDKVVIKDGDKEVTVNYLITTTAGELRIAKASADDNKPSIKDKKEVYDGTEKQLDMATASQEGTTILYSKDGENWIETMPTFTEAGEHTVYVKAENKNYETAITSAVLTITQRALDLTAISETKQYNGSEQTTEGYNTGADQLVSGHTMNGVTASVTGRNVGTYTVAISDPQNVIVQDQNGNTVTSNYKITTAPGTLTITPAPAGENKVVLSGAEVLYDGMLHKLAAATSAISDGTSTMYYTTTPEDTDSWTTMMPEFGNAGTYTVYVKAVNANYADAKAEATLTIRQRPLNIQGESRSVIYTGQEQSATEVTYGEGNLVIGHTTSANALAKGTAVGMYEGRITEANDVKVFDAFKNDVTVNYLIRTNPGTLSINAAGAEGNLVSFAGDSTIYDGTQKQLAAAVPAVAEGTTLYYTKTPNDPISWSTTMPTFTEAGSYMVYAKAKNSNFEDSQASAVMNITKRDIVLTANSKSDAVYTGEIYTVEGFNVGENQLAAGQEVAADSKAEGTDAGEYEVVITKAEDVKIMSGEADAAKNYNITTIPGKLIIAKASGNEVTINKKSEEYDANKHKLDEATSKITEDTTILYSKDGKEWSKEMPKFTDAGNHIVYVKVENKNYDDVYGEGILTINKRPIILTGNSNLEAVYSGDTQSVSGYEVGSKGTAEGHKITADAIASGADVGSYQGTITDAQAVTIKEGDKETTANYEVTTIAGKLEIAGTVSYHLNGASSGEEPKDNSKYSYGQNVAVALQGDVKRDNAIFLGWSQKEIPLITSQKDEDAAAAGIVTTLSMAKKSIELFAVWALDSNGPEGKPDNVPDYKEASVSYDANGGRGTMRDDNLYLIDSLYTVKENEFSRNGYIFTGWDTERNGSGEAFIAGDNMQIKGDATLYAQWEEDVIGEGENPDAGDDIPDRYQVIVNFAAVNGNVNLDRTVVTLRDETGKPSEEGSGTLNRVAAATANTGYSQESQAWEPEVPRIGMKIIETTTFTATFTAIAVTPGTTPPANPGTTPPGGTAPTPTDGTPAAVTPITVLATIAQPLTALADNVGEVLNAGVQELVQVDNEGVPLANKASTDHKCCILQLLLMMLALVLEISYTKSIKKRQQRIFELRKEIALTEKENANQKANEEIA